LKGLKNEVIMPRYSRTAYDHAARTAGATIIEVDTREQFEAVLGSRTALIMVLARGTSQAGPLPIKEIASLARPRGIPVLVDAATEGLEVPNPYLADGADLVAYSGGKRLRGPQCAGLLIGRKDLVQAAWISSAPHHGFGRGFKVGREEIMGMLACRDVDEARHRGEWQTWMSWVTHIPTDSADQGVKLISAAQARGCRSHAVADRQWDVDESLSGYDVETCSGKDRAWRSAGRIVSAIPPNFKPTNKSFPSSLEAGETLIADRVFVILSNPPPLATPEPPAFNIGGQWDLELKFVAGSAKQSFAIEQKGSRGGTHYASFRRDLSGAL
jgi:hypothetical protein